MPRATWKGFVLAEAPPERVEIVEGNVYFPPDSIQEEYLRPTDDRTVCPWKGTASYYDVVVESSVNRAAAWYYPTPKDAAKRIAGHVAFWRGVDVER